MVLPEAAPIALDARGDRDLDRVRTIPIRRRLSRHERVSWLRKLDAISSVSGGSIAAGLLGAV